MAMFKQVADIKTADMLDLPVPEVEYHNIAVKPSQVQKEMVASLGERAEKIRGGNVDSSVDNMLKVTNDGRKLALDQRMMNPMLPDEEGSKVNACVNEVFRIWEENSDKKLTQLLFCDLSTPKGAGEFSVYTDIRQKLIEHGIPESEIKFIHEADTEAKKQELFKKVRRGEVRILMGSTQKMGAGTNVQNKIIASHDLDCPWRPADLEQRAGRTVRQGNENPKVGLYRYVTEGTFDAYCWQLVEGKQKFSSQIMTSKSPVRSCEDVDATALSYAEIKMLAADNPHIKEKMDLDIQVQKLRLLKSNYLSEKYELEDKIIKYYPTTIARTKETIAGLEKDILLAKEHPKPLDDTFVGIEVKGVSYSEKAEGGQKIIDAVLTGIHILIIQILNTVIFFVVTSVICISFSSNLQKAEQHLMLYNIELQQQAGTDPLTTLYNRRRMEEVLKNHIRANPNENFSIAIGDIDFFKKINDTYGHNCGDQVLKSLSDLFREKTLGAGHVCRWGGEEFLFFFPKMNLDNAAVLMNEINIAVSKCIISYKDITIHVTMTFGVEENDFQSSISDIVKRADDKLYYGKTHGRDTVIS